MGLRYVMKKTSYLFEQATGSARRMVLIFGDEVATSGDPTNGRVPVEFRGRSGFINEDALGDEAPLELYFIDVGQGDSTFIVTPQRKKILVDGGVNNRALGFLTWKYRLDQPGERVDIDLLVLSHADSDHIDGLVPVIRHPRIGVKQIIHSGIATYNPGVFETSLGKRIVIGGEKFLETRHDDPTSLPDQTLSSSFSAWRQAIATKGAGPACMAADSTTGKLDIGDPSVAIGILAPRLDKQGGQSVYRWFDDEAHTINAHSVVLRLTYRQVNMLLAGDLNIQGAKHLLDDTVLAKEMSAHVFKAPHHGSNEYYRPFLEAVNPQISIISSGDEPDHGHPRANFIGAVGKASRSDAPLVFSTEIAATFVEADSPTGDSEPEGTDAKRRLLFKQRLHGMINVRTDGQQLYAARRVAAGYWWEAYGPLPPV